MFSPSSDSRFAVFASCGVACATARTKRSYSSRNWTFAAALGCRCQRPGYVARLLRSSRSSASRVSFDSLSSARHACFACRAFASAASSDPLPPSPWTAAICAHTASGTVCAELA